MNDERTLAQKLLSIMHLVRRRINADLRHLDKKRSVEPAHFPVLASLRQRAYSVSELAARLEVSLPSMSKTITALVKRGWVERVRLEQDRRVVQLHITSEGKATLGEMYEQAVSAVAGMLDPLEPDERQRLADGLDVLYQALGEAVDRLPPAPPHRSDKEE